MPGDPGDAISQVRLETGGPLEPPPKVNHLFYIVCFFILCLFSFCISSENTQRVVLISETAAAAEENRQKTDFQLHSR